MNNPLIPLKPGTKVPAVSGWADPDYRTPDYVDPAVDEVAMRCDDLVVVDCDGDAAVNFWVNHVGLVNVENAALVVKTPRGLHVHYAWSPGSPTGPAVGVFPGIDIRAGRGSYVVMPPTPGYKVIGGTHAAVCPRLAPAQDAD